MKGNQKFLSGLLLGAAAGAAVAALLQGERGETIVKNVKSSVKNMVGDLKDCASHISATANSWANKGRDLVNEYGNGNAENEAGFDFEEIFS